ncbi:hypothetical protein Hanom_Chr03g00204791 [Helianthus anomalus]
MFMQPCQPINYRQIDPSSSASTIFQLLRCRFDQLFTLVGSCLFRFLMRPMKL